MKKTMRSWGMSEEDVHICAKQIEDRQKQKRQGLLAIDAPLCTMGVYVRYLRKQPNVTSATAAALRLGDDYEEKSDKGYTPSRVDSVLKGAARAMGETAKAVKRGKTITKFQYDERS